MADGNGIGSLTEAEQKYLSSGGTDSAGLVTELQSTTALTPPETKAEPAAPVKVDDKAAPAAAPAAGDKPAAAAPAADEPEVGEEEVATPDGKGKRRMVDSRALKEARKRAQALETKLQEEQTARAKDNEARAVVNERLRLLTEAVQTAPAADAAAAAEPEVPDPEKDIFGFVAHLRKNVEELTGKIGQMTEQTVEERQQAATIRNYFQDSATFTQQNPDFRDAYNHLFGLRKRQLEIQGYTPEQVNKFIFDEEMNHVQRSVAANRSPSAGLYELAKLAGYAPKPPAPTPGDAAALAAAAAAGNGAAPANGHAAAPAAPAPAAPAPAPASVSDEVDRIRAGQAASRSLSQGAGGGGDELSIEALANMPMAEFEKLVRSKAGAVERALGRLN